MIKMNTFANRRKLLMEKMGSHDVMILPASVEVLRNGDAHYPYRQQSDFYYLTGFREPEAVLLLLPNREEGEYVLFNRVRDPAREIWDGPRAGQAGAMAHFLADQSFPIEELEHRLPDLLADRDKIHYTLGQHIAFDKTLLKALNEVRAKVRSGIKAPSGILDIAPSIHEMRLFKSQEELTLIQKAIDITAEGHMSVMKACKPDMYEYELEALFLYECHRQGARFQAYTPIIGSGKNSCVLHYIANNERIKNGDLVLMDAGAEFEYYASDITRTFPANGTFSPEQRAIYELVLASQLAAIDTLKPGVRYQKTQEIIVEIITQGLIDLGILKGNCSQLIEEKAYLPFYMHRSGHWLGLDVHDVGQYKEGNAWRQFEPGMLLTIEPGIYISADLKEVDPSWHHIGVRIEDNILITEHGCKVLSHAIPKTIDDIEVMMSRG